MGKKKDEPFNNPFAAAGKALEKQLKAAQVPAAPPKPVKAPPPPEVPARDEDLFAAAVAGARRVNDPRGVLQPPLPSPVAEGVPVYDEEAEAYRELASLVDGSTHFDFADSDEFIEGCMEGLDRRILQRLRRGDYAFRVYLDLHGMTRDVAKDAVDRFVTERRREGDRCVLIVHGRGHNSKDNIPVLKTLLKSWLERGRIARCVLAFCTALPHDGGAGAVYVLLRR